MFRTLPIGAKNICALPLMQGTSSAGQRGDYLLATVSVAILTLLSLGWNRSLFHWFLLPCMACGALAGGDVVRALRGRIDFFDPKAIIGCLAFYGFFVAPLLNVGWDTYGVGDLAFWGDWRPWFGAMAFLNCVGLLAYRYGHNLAFDRIKPSATSWRIDRKKFYPLFAFALLVSMTAAVTFILQSRSKVIGIVEIFDSYLEALSGKGWLMTLAWPSAVLSFIFLVFAWTDRQKKAQRHLVTGLLLVSLAALGHFLLLGWYGSRSATIWAIFWMTGIIHYRVRKLSSTWVALGVIFLIAFMYLYGFYKERGTASYEAIQSPTMWLDPPGYQRDFKLLLLTDLARADIDAYLLRNLIKDPGDYDYRWGLTYVGALAILIPRYFWPNRPEMKIEAGTEAQHGKATTWMSVRVYGLSGEALLNFGPLGVAPMFALYGVLLGWYRKKLFSWNRCDARMFLAPFFSILFITGFTGDSDNVVFGAVSEGALIVLALYASSNRFAVRT